MLQKGKIIPENRNGYKVSNLSAIYRHKALHENSKESLKEAKEIALITYKKCLELYKERDLLTLFNMENLAYIYLANRNRIECEEAYILAKKVYNLRKVILSNDHFETQNAKNLLRDVEMTLKSLN